MRPGSLEAERCRRLDSVFAGAVTLTAGADVFAGPVDTLYGQFHSNDRVYLEISWKF